MHPPKVLMAAHGNDCHSLRTLDLLLNRECQIVFLDIVNPFPEGRRGFTFERFPYPRGGRYLLKFFGQRVGSKLLESYAIPRLRRLRSKLRPALVHLHWVDDRAYYCVKSGFRPIIFTVLGSDINRHFLPNANPVFRQRVGTALGSANLVIIDSADMHGKCSELAGKRVQTELLTAGIDTDLFRPGYSEAAREWRQRLEIPPDAKVILSIRGWSPLYRHEQILDAFSRALPRFKTPAVLVFKILKRPTMDRHIYEKQMRLRVNEAGLNRHVRWMESVPRDQLPEVYSFADVIINYPSMDAFPVTFIEAAACQCPVISCRLPAYAGTFAEHSFNLVSGSNLSELTDAIVRFVNDGSSAMKAQLTKLRASVCNNFDEELVVRKLLGLYTGLMPSGESTWKRSGLEQCSTTT